MPSNPKNIEKVVAKAIVLSTLQFSQARQSMAAGRWSYGGHLLDRG
jgi:hypothetical protein